MTQIVIAFYKFVSLPDFAEKQRPLLAHCQQQGINGTIILAAEGINGTIAGSRQGIDSVLAFLQADPNLADLEYKQSYANSPPFKRLKVRLKKEIVTLALPEVDPNERVGTYVNPKDWNTLISDPEVTIIDTRNLYEVEIGSFKNAQNPQTESFRQFPGYVHRYLDPNQHKKIAMFCTGGIRCEKASSFMLSQGFEEVYQLQGGILRYLEEIPAAESLWQGECFVFDERIAVTHGLAAGSYDLCRSCGHPISEADKTKPQYQDGISCPYCFDKLTAEKIKRQKARQQQLNLAKQKHQNA
ncbi:MAG: rhodanese-related sulfurtransferase [Symploca sp. SIO1C4]|uniref:tRNA uridine(34) hydroxylase n=1 Tax=Symploca sp. SIO1C4 TaxID=2607765 RepID=A0A6B3NBH1_9CYAN|nr:rhodanese-related sulfurtransferase [Symploca sp. SIO1C4]